MNAALYKHVESLAPEISFSIGTIDTQKIVASIKRIYKNSFLYALLSVLDAPVI